MCIRDSDNVKPLSCPSGVMCHYDLADEGSEGKKLSVLTAAVDKHLDKQRRERNMEAEVRARSSTSPVPGMAAEPRPRRRRSLGKKKNALIADARSDAGSNAGSDRTDDSSVS